MFGPEYKAGCPSCSAIADGFNGIITHLANHDVMLWAVSRAPLAKLQAYKQRMGWSFPWASSFGGDFNFDFSASFTEEQQREGAYYNFRRDDPVMNAGRGALTNPVTTGNAGTTGTDLSHIYTRAGGPKRLRARGRRHLSHLLRLCARCGRHLEHVPVARPRA